MSHPNASLIIEVVVFHLISYSLALGEFDQNIQLFDLKNSLAVG